VLGLELGLVSEVVAAFKATAMLPRSQGLGHATLRPRPPRGRGQSQSITPLFIDIELADKKAHEFAHRPGLV